MRHAHRIALSDLSSELIPWIVIFGYKLSSPTDVGFKPLPNSTPLVAFEGNHYE